jgi:signal transduction histidine kinase
MLKVIGNKRSLRVNSLIWMFTLIFTYSGFNFLTFFTMRRQAVQMADMVDRGLLVSELEQLNGKATEGLPYEIELFSVRPDAEKKKLILSKFHDIQSRLTRLKEKTADAEAITQVRLLSNMFTSMQEHFEEIVRLVESGSGTHEINQNVTEVKEASELIFDSLHRLLFQGLRIDSEVNKKIQAESHRNNLALIFGIAIFSSVVALLLYYYLFIRRIFGPLHEMQIAMERIANKPRDISMRVEMVHDDEIGQLSSYFNRMADKIQKSTEGLENSVEERTHELSLAQARLLDSARLSALGEMAAGVAHEINNPLTIVIGHVGQMKSALNRNEVDVEKLKARAESIENTSYRIAKIVKGLKLFSRETSKDMSVLSTLESIIEGTLALCAEKLKGRGIELRGLDGLEKIEFECRPTEISQVLLNLLNNASDAVESIPEKWIELSAKVRGDSFQLRIIDSGKGIPLEVQGKLFHPFFTTKELGKGTGLGLSISKGIIERHGGTLAIDATGKNTAFLITLPLKSPSQA